MKKPRFSSGLLWLGKLSKDLKKAGTIIHFRNYRLLCDTFVAISIPLPSLLLVTKLSNALIISPTVMVYFQLSTSFPDFSSTEKLFPINSITSSGFLGIRLSPISKSLPQSKHRVSPLSLAVFVSPYPQQSGHFRNIYIPLNASFSVNILRSANSLCLPALKFCTGR